MGRIVLLILAFGAVLGAQEPRRDADVIYHRENGVALTLDVFRPAGEPSGAGVIFVVSGGWFSSPLWIRPRFFQELLDRGHAVFAVVHGSQPKYTIPEIVPHVRRAVRYVRHRAKDYGVDPGRLGLLGLSAGGHLSLLVALDPQEGTPEAGDPVERQPSRVRAVAAFYPPTDFLNWGKDGVSVADLPVREQFRAPFEFQRFDPEQRTYVRITEREEYDAELRRLSPVTHVSADDPPALLLHGDQDRLVPLQQSERIRVKLAEAGVDVRLVVKEGAGHGWRGMQEDLALVADWFTERLGPPPPSGAEDEGK